MSKTATLPRGLSYPQIALRLGAGPDLSKRPWLKRAASAFGALLALTAGGEVASRFDDRLFNDIPLAASPDRGFDLIKAEPWGYRGRPDGHFRRWKLNSHGFLGPEIAENPRGTRIMVLGASETFGLFEGRDRDYPSQLAAELARRKGSRVEVINAGIAGQALPALEQNWIHWSSRFRPNIVLIYPAAHFYLDNEPPVARPPSPEILARRPSVVQTRFGERILDQVKQIPLLRSIRANREIAAALKGRDDDYMFRTPPVARLEALSHDLERVAAAVEKSGARPVLITHAFKNPLVLNPADRRDLQYFRIYFPRATHEVFPQFSMAARDVVRDLGIRRGWQVIDAAAKLSGRRDLFSDPVHFTADGARELAGLIADEIGDRIGLPSAVNGKH